MGCLRWRKQQLRYDLKCRLYHLFLELDLGRIFSIGGKPSQVITPVSSAADKSFSLSWDAPANNGSPIIGYKVQYSIDEGSTWSTVATTSSTSYNFTVTNGLTYVGRVIAYNAVGDGVASSASTGRVPAFAAAASISSRTSTPTTSNRGYRSFTVTVDPPTVASFSHAVLQTKLSSGSWTTREANITNTGSTEYTYAATASEVYSARIITYNTDGYYEITEIASNINIPALIDDSYTVPAFAGSGYHAEVAAVAEQAYIAPSWGGDTWGPWQSVTHVMLNGSATGSKYVSVTNNSTQQPNGIQARNVTYNGSVSQVSNGGDGSTRAVCYVVNGVRYFIGTLAQGGDPSAQSITRGTGGNWGMGATGSGWSTNNTSGESGSSWYYCDVRIRYQYYNAGQPYIAPVAYQAAYWDNPPYDAYTVTQSY